MCVYVYVVNWRLPKARPAAQAAQQPTFRTVMLSAAARPTGAPKCLQAKAGYGSLWLTAAGISGTAAAAALTAAGEQLAA
jgi:hypothetical protein